nr:immunoglobulin light chain junction region [Macaca mulatta]MOX16750.1 immunoglobulin light chain junction region [Macaca mulatta]MOX16754.1 immunoglobulin light chain junction region [Macaca mulatta]MOX16883.1 immunoglobulin light chain junction region [Macaca mulatta]MOX17007.1 immunoglobulin light chain junction region [Macaca mulatta]
DYYCAVGHSSGDYIF